MGITFEHVEKSYPGGTRAVVDFSLSIPSHSTAVFLGSSGCGKTTLLRMVNRMVEPTSGRVLIDDHDIASTDPVKLRRSIGYVLQGAGLLPHVSVEDNIATVPVLNGTRRAVARGAARELMDLVGLDRSLARRYPSQLSGGQQQRVGVARALAADPNILLMDEPFGAVDPIVRRDLQRELVRLQRDLGKTVVFVTHDVDEAFTLGDHVVILDHGARIVQQGTPADIVAQPADDFVRTFIGADDTARALSIRDTPGGRVVTDGRGRPVGRIVDESP